MKLTKEKFGELKGQEVSLFTIENSKGTKVKITNYGCIIVAVEMADKNGHIDNVVCGFENLEGYLDDAYLSSYPYFGCILGRCANRIAKGKYTIDGNEYTGVVNNGPNHLHGGTEGFDRKLWNVDAVSEDKGSLTFSYLSADGEEGYPGELKVVCTYTFNEEGELKVHYQAETNKKTIINISNHSYFNLTGGENDVLGHELELSAKKYTESVDAIPTGNILSVDNSPFDFTTKKALGKDIAELPEGYDLNMVLDNEKGDLIYAGCLSEPTSGRHVEVKTTQPGVQVYTGFWIPELEINGQKKFGKYSGVALETQHYPDTQNHSNFPTVELNPGEEYNETTIYKFYID